MLIAAVHGSNADALQTFDDIGARPGIALGCHFAAFHVVGGKDAQVFQQLLAIERRRLLGTAGLGEDGKRNNGSAEQDGPHEYSPGLTNPGELATAHAGNTLNFRSVSAVHWNQPRGGLAAGSASSSGQLASACVIKPSMSRSQRRWMPAS